MKRVPFHHLGLMWLLLYGLCCGMPARAAAPQVRVNVQARQPVLVGQQVHIAVTVMTPNYFTSAPAFPVISIPGAIVTMPDESGQNSTDQVGGVTYAGIQKIYIFSAQQAGDFTLPPLKITFTYGGDNGQPQHGSVTLPATRISAKLAEGAAAAASANGGALMPVARITISQQFDRPVGGHPSSFHVGDALVRTLNTYAVQTQSMMIPPPHVDAPPGVRVFAADPKLSDETKDRVGLLGGRRIDRLTYVFERPGTYTLPAVRIGWFNAAANRQETAEAPALPVTVLAALPGSAAAIAPEAASIASATTANAHAKRQWHVVEVARAAVVLLLAMMVVRWLVRRWPSFMAQRAARQAQRAASEPVLFQAVVQAGRTHHASQTYAALLAWSSHLNSGVSAWCAAQRDPALVAALGDLESRLFNPDQAKSSDAWQATPLLKALKPARATWLQRRQQQASMAALPALNP